MRTFLTIILALTGACSSSFMEEGDFFFIERNKAEMPVWVKGNLDSDRFVVFLHGGPGDSAINFALVGWQALEEDFTVVYWDQRHSGLSQGNANPNKTSVADYADDLELVLDTLELRYQPEKVFLFGTSWGAPWEARISRKVTSLADKPK